MSVISGIYIIDRKGKIIIFRNYRGEVDQNISNVFCDKVLELDESGMKPVFSFNGVHYIWIKHQDIYLVAVGKRNINVALIISFLYMFRNLLADYFGILEEETIKDNFVLIYELLDEIMDHGYPQITDSKILKDLIVTGSNKKIEKKDKSITSTMTNVVSWRKEGIFYKNNEVSVEVIERVDELISSSGNVLSSQIFGIIRMKSQLSGMPTINLCLNDKVPLENSAKESPNNINIEIDDLKFHQCVNKKKFDLDRTIEFIPPDGEFELMSYRLNLQLKPLFLVKVEVNRLSETKYKYKVKAKANFKNKIIANHVAIFIPVPLDIQNAEFISNAGTVMYLSDREDLLWSIQKFEGQKEFDLSLSFGVPSVRIEDPEKHMKRPVQLSFEIPSWTMSGLQVRYINVREKCGYESIPYVKYVTLNGEYYIRGI